MGAGFQFSPGGIIPIPPPGAFDATAVQGAATPSTSPAIVPQPYDPEAIPVEAPRLALPAPAVIARAATSAPNLAAAAVTPRTVMKAARARLKEIKAELKRHEALKKERAQLERMLAAAGKPLASLTHITSRRAG